MAPHLPITSISQPPRNFAASVQQGANATQRTQMLKNKSIELDKYLQIVEGYCPVCFAIKGILVNRHKPMVSGCNVNGIPTNWWRFKKLFKLDKYLFCYCCGVLGGDLEPVCHKKVEKKPGFVCPWDDFTFVVVFALWHSALTQQKIKAAFGLDQNMQEFEFEVWAGQSDEQAGKYYNFLEVFLWYCRSWELKCRHH